MKVLNQTYRILIFSLFSLALLFSSCSKSDEDEQSPKTELLTKSAWKMNAYTVEPGFPTFDSEGNITGSTNDIFAFLDDCEKDDTHKFNTDKSLTTDEGMTKCESSDPQKTNGTWSYNSDETILTITEDGETQTATVLELTSNVLKLKSTETYEGMTYTYTVTFLH
jgi:hypothetical protein